MRQRPTTRVVILLAISLCAAAAFAATASARTDGTVPDRSSPLAWAPTDASSYQSPIAVTTSPAAFHAPDATTYQSRPAVQPAPSSSGDHSSWSDHTVAIVLASLALLIAMLAAGYTSVRVASLRRQSIRGS